MWISELWRYPVKSMAGESLQSVTLLGDGVEGDRSLLVEDRSGRILTSRTHPGLLGHRASRAADGSVLVDGRSWADPSVAADVIRAAGPGALLVPSEPEGRFDVLPLLVASDGAIAAMGVDGRRFRPNVVVGGLEGLAERAWEGRVLQLGECLVLAHQLRARCVMTTYDPDTQAQDVRILRRIVQEFDGVLGLDCSVRRGGTLRVGDPVTLVA